MFKPAFKLKTQTQTPTKGLFILEPLEQGYGHSLGTALRRVLLTSISGHAVTKVKIKGVSHRFSTLEGLKEDVVELLLNIKQIRIDSELTKDFKLKLEVSGPKTVVAADIKIPAGVTIVNSDLVLATLATRKNKLEIEFTASRGYGFVAAAESQSGKMGEIMVDALFSPVVLVNYKVEATRVGRRTDYDKLILEVTTDGSIKPKNAVLQAAQILMDYFKQIYEPRFIKKKVIKSVKEPEVYKLTVEELNLPTRIANALRKGGYKIVKDLVGAKPEEIAKIKNLGKKSVTTIIKKLKDKEVILKEL
ncbi:DNA-directed RNA polymerase subunit alpha [Patescibacteria group bacterium]|nr:DNA-directed RNA polymerase subunit alpha [Patescibacteria group bacterium]MBU1931306.1 DNA-directed RNA polymerase subunit alpha [Patescibacteria group bacterium]